jgi:hypothetical protein
MNNELYPSPSKIRQVNFGEKRVIDLHFSLFGEKDGPFYFHMALGRGFLRETFILNRFRKIQNDSDLVGSRPGPHICDQSGKREGRGRKDAKDSNEE